MAFGTGRIAATLGLTLSLWFVVPAKAQTSLENFNPDPRSTVTFAFDVDGTLTHNLGHFVVKLASKPGIPGLIRVSGLPQEVEIPVHDFEGTTGLRIRDLIGRMDGDTFVHGRIEPITLSNGTKIIPGHYYFDVSDGYRQFRPASSGKPEDGYAYQALLKKLEEQNPFLLEAMPFLAAGYSEEYGKRIRVMLNSMRGQAGNEWALVLDKMADFFNWGPKRADPSLMFNLTHDDFLNFSQSKGKFLQTVYHHISRINIDMKKHNVPHFLVMFENDFDKHLDEIHLKFRALSDAGIFQNPVIPILVDLLEPDAFDNRGGTDWNRSALETAEKRYRVQIYWGPGNIETSNDLSLVFQKTLGLSKEAATALYQKFENPYMCRNIMSGKKTVSCVLGECLTGGAK